jgi:hypothetical protein
MEKYSHHQKAFTVWERVSATTNDTLTMRAVVQPPSEHLFEHRYGKTLVAHENGNLACLFRDDMVRECATQELLRTLSAVKVALFKPMSYQIGHTRLADDLLKFHGCLAELS